MIIEMLTVGGIGANCYIVGDVENKEGLIIDPGAEAGKILAKVSALGLKINYIVLTHGHLDHIEAVDAVRQGTGAKVLLHPLDGACLTDPKQNLSAFFGQPVQGQPADEFVQEGQIIRVGGTDFTVLHTPGHTPGGICLTFPGGVFTGDTLFAGSIGRTDFPGGSMEALLEGIKVKLLTLDPATKVYPGHGPGSTIGEEMDSNPFL